MRSLLIKRVAFATVLFCLVTLCQAKVDFAKQEHVGDATPYDSKGATDPHSIHDHVDSSYHANTQFAQFMRNEQVKKALDASRKHMEDQFGSDYSAEAEFDMHSGGTEWLTEQQARELVPETSLRRALFELLDPEMNGAIHRDRWQEAHVEINEKHNDDYMVAKDASRYTMSPAMSLQEQRAYAAFINSHDDDHSAPPQQQGYPASNGGYTPPTSPPPPANGGYQAPPPPPPQNGQYGQQVPPPSGGQYGQGQPPRYGSNPYGQYNGGGYQPPSGGYAGGYGQPPQGGAQYNNPYPPPPPAGGAPPPPPTGYGTPPVYNNPNYYQGGQQQQQYGQPPAYGQRSPHAGGQANNEYYKPHAGL